MKCRVEQKMLSVILPKQIAIGAMAELADAYALGAYDFGHKSSTLFCPTNSFSSTTVIKKCCDRCCIDDKVLHCRKGMDKKTDVSERNTSLRNFLNFSFIPTTAYFLAMPTSFF